MRHFLIALQFLTILPIKIKGEIEKEDFGKSCAYFPFVGMLIGLLLTLSLFAFGFLPHLAASVLILIISIIISGGIHLDGFADTCDGFYAGKTPPLKVSGGSIPVDNSKEKILEVMRDSRIGVMGVIGVVSLMLLKFSLIASASSFILWKLLIVMAVFERWSQALACYLSVYARKEGKAKYFVEYAGRKELFIGGLITLASFLFLMNIKGLFMFTFSLFPIFLFINYAKKKIGGMTGDTIGAVNEIAGVCVLLLGLIIVPRA
ncbi:MAG: adenosylcobinamide-GDP ribazoletransferase [Candidatus Omnitrophica bacterium]|nr:adenosylcobinamide-GDP ribazoletransferase [Candidatus Omnitrophota bacterium]